MIEILIGIVSGIVSGIGMGGGTILIFLLGIVLSIAICSFAQGYTSAQETLRSQISSYIANKGLNPEKQNQRHNGVCRGFGLSICYE